MRQRFRNILLACCPAPLCLIGVVRSLAQESSKEGASEGATTFVLRVNPEWADRVNAVLKRVAHPSEVALPAGMTPADLVQHLWGLSRNKRKNRTLPRQSIPCR